MGTTEQLEGVVAAVLEEGRRRWPTVTLEPHTFASYLRERVDGCDQTASLAAIQALDLFLACACAEGQSAAIAAFERLYLPGVRAALRGLRVELDAIDDVVSRLREELFIGGANTPPKIRQYAGRSSMQAWLQVVATRMGLRLLGRERRLERTDVDDQPLEGNLADPELAHLKVVYRHAFQIALREAAAALSSRDRNLLRYQYVERLSGDEIASLYGVNRSTVVRWQRQACDAVLEGTRHRLVQHAAVDRRDFDSITRLVQSQLDFSIRELFGAVDVSAR